MTTLQNIETALSADWQKAVALLQEGEQWLANFLSKVSTGAEVLVEDIEQAAQLVLAKIGVVSTAVGALSSAASIIAPNDAAVAKLVSDLATGVQDAQVVATAIRTGNTANSSTAVKGTVTAIGAVSTLGVLAGQASAALSSLANQSSTATQAVSPPTPATS